MNKQTEKMFLEFNKFIEENGGKTKNEEEARKLFTKFMEQYQPEPPAPLSEKTAESSYDFMELCTHAQTRKDALKYAKKALELDPDNLDAASAIACMTASSNEKLAEKYKKLIDEADKKLEAKGYFGEDYMGKFWLITETRPYMRLLSDYAELLSECEQMRLSAAVYEKMLRLCTSDNLGVRYSLMHIYAFLEEQQAAEELFKKYPEDSAQILLPFSILYYKLGDLRSAWRYLKKLGEANRDTYKFFKSATEGKVSDLIKQTDMSIGYRPYTIEEFVAASNENTFLYVVASTYFVWAFDKLKSEKKK